MPAGEIDFFSQKESLLYNAYLVASPGVKRPRREADH